MSAADTPHTAHVEGGRVGADRATDRASVTGPENVPGARITQYAQNPLSGSGPNITVPPDPASAPGRSPQKAAAKAAPDRSGCLPGRSDGLAAGYCARHGDV
ncbi:hypothetical protein GCM10023079_34680 [Streptomyces chitinivorans]